MAEITAGATDRRRSVTCPSCAMETTRTDRRQLVPVILDDPAFLDTVLRRCRNCLATIDLTTDSPRILSNL